MDNERSVFRMENLLCVCYGCRKKIAGLWYIDLRFLSVSGSLSNCALATNCSGKNT